MDWSYLNQYMPQSQYYEQDWNNHHYSSQNQWGYNSPESYCQPPFQHSTYNFPSHDQLIEKKSKAMKSIEFMIESQEQKLKMMDSQFLQDSQIQDPYSMFQVLQQEEEPIDSDRSMENLIQSENNFFQSPIG